MDTMNLFMFGVKNKLFQGGRDNGEKKYINPDVTVI